MTELLEKIKGLDKQKLAAVVAAFAIIVVLDGVFVVTWQIRSASKAKERIVQLKASIVDIERASQDFARKSQNTQLSGPQAKTAVGVNDLPVLLQKISVIAKECNVRVNQITHVKETKIASSRPGEPVQPQAQGLIPVTIRLDLVGGYHNLGKLVNLLENAAEPIAAQEMRVSSDRAEFQKLRINLTLKTFVRG